MFISGTVYGSGGTAMQAFDNQLTEKEIGSHDLPTPVTAGEMTLAM
ncbi:hypothetical protein OH492_16125 [Vibrio chagasii]|nr:hypothetical protein [Vibrio chagasii]